MSAAYTCMLTICLLGIWFSSQWMLAGLSQHQVDQATINEGWTALAPPPPEIWQAMQTKLETRHVFQSKLSQPQRLLGLLYEMQPTGNEGDVVNNWPEILKIYRRVVTLSPGWPDDWTQLAWAKFMLRELDNEFLRALQNALMLGTDESRLDIQLSILAPVGMAMQPDPDSYLFFLANNHILKSLQSGENYELTLGILENTGLLAGYCQELDVMTTRAPLLNRCNSLNNPDQ